MVGAPPRQGILQASSLPPCAHCWLREEVTKLHKSLQWSKEECHTSIHTRSSNSRENHLHCASPSRIPKGQPYILCHHISWSTPKHGVNSFEVTPKANPTSSPSLVKESGWANFSGLRSSLLVLYCSYTNSSSWSHCAIILCSHFCNLYYVAGWWHIV